jgi:hypothetical protein
MSDEVVFRKGKRITLACEIIVRGAFCDPILSGCRQSLRGESKRHLTAIGAVARKLYNIIFVILGDNRSYEASSPTRQ